MKMSRKGILLIMILAIALIIPGDIPSVKAASPEDIEDAIDLGLEWLAAQQYADGYWNGSYKVATTGLAVLKFETHATRQGIDPLDPSYTYYDQVRDGLDYIFSRAFNISISVQPAGDPDTNGDGKGVYIYYSSSHRMYETGIAAMAIAASTHPEMVVNVLGSQVNGLNYSWVLQNVVDYIAYGQNDPTTGVYRGGWRYRENYGSSDNSVSGYATLGLVYAESPPPIGFGLTVPQFVKDELSLWIDYIQNDVNGDIYDGGSGYTHPNSWVNILKTGNLLQQMAFVGDTLATPRVQDAIHFIERWWNDTGNGIYWGGWKNGTATSNYQAAYTCMKGFEAFNIDLIDQNGYTGVPGTPLYGDGTPEFDWFDDMTTEIVDEQKAAGYWSGDPWGDTELATEWALLVLQKEAPPILKYDLHVVVEDASTGDPIPGATVIVAGPETRSDITNATGFAEFLDLLVGDYNVTASAPGYMTGSAGITLAEDMTIIMELWPSAAATIESADVVGNKKDVFDIPETVYVIGSGYTPGATYDLYVVEDTTWTPSMNILTDCVVIVHTTVTADGSGDIPIGTAVWGPGLTPGYYDIIVDVNGDGLYDTGDALDDGDIEVKAGFFVIPELPFGTILSLVISLAALVLFRTKRLHFIRP